MKSRKNRDASSFRANQLEASEAIRKYYIARGKPFTDEDINVYIRVADKNNLDLKYIFKIMEFSLGNNIETKRFMLSAQIIDFLLEPQSAESTIGDLHEQYIRRLKNNRRHAMRWLWFQTGWIIFNRALDVIRKVAAARAGK